MEGVKIHHRGRIRTEAQVTLLPQVQGPLIRITIRVVDHQQPHIQRMNIINNKILAIKIIPHLNLVNIRKVNSSTNSINNRIRINIIQIEQLTRVTKMKYPLNTMVIFFFHQ